MVIGRIEKTGQGIGDRGQGISNPRPGTGISAVLDPRSRVPGFDVHSSFTLADARSPKSPDTSALKAQAKRFGDVNPRTDKAKPFIVLNHLRYTHEDIDRMVFGFGPTDGTIREAVAKFFIDHLPQMIEEKFFTADHFDKIVGYFENSEQDGYQTYGKFFDEYLPLLIKNNFFTVAYCDKIACLLKRGNGRLVFEAFQLFW